MDDVVKRGISVALRNQRNQHLGDAIGVSGVSLHDGIIVSTLSIILAS